MMSGVQITPYQEFAVSKLGYRFENIEYLVIAFTHRSYVNEHKKSSTQHNERQEFLGDAVLELVVTDYLFRNYSEPEGILTSWRAALVRTESIAAAGENLGYEPLMRMSKGEKKGSRRARQQILANAFEALIGAIYLERGYSDAEKFIYDNICAKLPKILDEGSWRDPKSHLQEIVQRVEGLTPVYRVVSESGPDHDKVFKLGVFVGVKKIAEGIGHSKQIAQQEAAKTAIKIYEQNDTKK